LPLVYLKITSYQAQYKYLGKCLFICDLCQLGSSNLQLSILLFRGNDTESYSLWVFHSGDALFRVSALIYKTVTLSVLLENVPKRPQPIPISKSPYLISPFMTCAVHMGLLHNLINQCALGGFLKGLKIDQISFNYSGLFGIIAS